MFLSFLLYAQLFVYGMHCIFLFVLQQLWLNLKLYIVPSILYEMILPLFKWCHYLPKYSQLIHISNKNCCAGYNFWPLRSFSNCGVEIYPCHQACYKFSENKLRFYYENGMLLKKKMTSQLMFDSPGVQILRL
jgi:hypothetical protein